MEWENTTDDFKEYTGFVYIIHNKTKDKWYVGQKQYFSKRRLKPLKGKKRRRLVEKESDWKKYTGSSKELNKDIKLGDEIVKKILYNCTCKWEMNYVETALQFKLGALMTEKSYNGIINLRIGNKPECVDMERVNKFLDSFKLE